MSMKTRVLCVFDGMPFNEDDIANSLTFVDAINAGFRITVDTNKENAIFVTSPHCDMTRKFIMSNSGLP